MRKLIQNFFQYKIKGESDGEKTLEEEVFWPPFSVSMLIRNLSFFTVKDI